VSRQLCLTNFHHLVSCRSISPFSSRIDDPRTSGGSAATSINQSPQRRPTITVPKMTAVTPTVTTPDSAIAPLSDLELRIDTERTIDLFSMQLKVCSFPLSGTRYIGLTLSAMQAANEPSQSPILPIFAILPRCHCLLYTKLDRSTSGTPPGPRLHPLGPVSRRRMDGGGR
jgi:hypothetical protein